MKSFVLLLSVVAVMTYAPGLNVLVHAQQAPGGRSDPRGNARMRLGIFYLSPSVSIDRLGYDSNVRNAAGEPRADFTASIRPQTTVWVPFANRALLTSDASVGFDYYKTFTRERSVNPGVNVRGELFLRRLTLFAGTGTSRSRRQPNDEIERRVGQSQSSLTGGFAVGLFRGLSAEMSAYRQTSGFDEREEFGGVRLGDVLDRVEEGFRMRLRARLTSLTTVGMVAETRQDRFDRASGRDADGYRLAATFDLDPKALISGTAEVGYRHFDPRNALVPAFKGVVARMAVSNRLPGSMVAGFGWDRDVHFSVDTIQPYYVSTGLSASLRRQLAGQYDAIVSAARTRSSYVAPSTVEQVSGRREVTTMWGVDIGRRLGRASRVGLGVSRVNRASTRSDARRYDTTRAGLSLRYVF